MRRQVAVLLMAALLPGCGVLRSVDWYPEGKDCRSKGCADGYECKVSNNALCIACTPRYSCQAIPTPPTPRPPESCAKTTCPADRPRCSETVMHGGGLMVECRGPLPLCGVNKEYPSGQIVNAGCYHDPDGAGWRYRCKDGVTDVAVGPGARPFEDEKACPAPPPPPVPPQPPAPPAATACPKELAEGAYVWVRAKRYGNGLDSEVNVAGDPEFCEAIHHKPGLINCHLEGWPKRLACEMELLGKSIGKVQACPIWKFRAPGANAFEQCFESPHPVMSCDHWGSAGGARDDPKTPEYTGEPAQCGEQRGPDGRVDAAFWIIANGAACVSACRPDGGGCSHDRPAAGCVEVDH